MKPAYQILALLLSACLSGSQASAQSFGYPAPTANQEKETREETTEAPKAQIRYNQVVTPAQAAALQAGQGGGQHILVFYEDFKISRTLSGQVSCSMKLSVLPLTQNKLSQLSIQLVWPEITSSSNFYDVPPYVKHYKKIALMGEGCYSIDKVPNIVSNRCRIKGMTSEECASLLTWSKVR